MSSVGVVLGLAFIICLTAQPILRRLLGQKVVDVPNSRSSHSVTTPRVGGVGVLLGMLPALLIPGTWLPVVAAWILGLVGLRDDVRPTSPPIRLALQLVVCLGAAVVASAHGMLPTAVIVLLMVAYINAFNFMDGVNGISALNGLLVGAVYLTTGHAYQVDAAAGVGAVLVGVSLGFLPFNMKGQMFLGDVGSYAYGSAIAVTGMVSFLSGVPWQFVLAPVSIYMADTGYTLFMRAVRRQSLLSPHRSHVYQRLTDVGVSHLGSAGISFAAGLLATLAAWFAVSGNALNYVLVVGVLVAYLASPYLVRHIGPLYLELSD